MFVHYLKTAWRNILKDKGYSTVNIIGLSIAIACCFLLLFWIRFELSYEKCYPGSERIYRIMEEENRTDGLHYKATVRPAIDTQLKNTFPQIEYSTFTSWEELPLTIEGKEGDGIMAKVLSTNEEFLRMFAYEYVEGSPEGVVESHGSIISEKAARKFFGNESAVGKTLQFDKKGDFNYTISAVVKMPENSHVTFDVLTLRDEKFYGGVHYIKLKQGANITPDFEKQMKRFLSTTRETKNTLKLQPIRDMHLHSPKEVTDHSFGSPAQIYFFSVAVLLILLIAVISYVNTSVARSLNRMKEVGVRKVFGSDRKQLVARFLLESFILSFIALLISLILVELLFPSFSEIMGTRIALKFDFGTILIAILTCLAVTVLSGGYAAFYLSSFSPMQIMKGGSKTGSKNGLRKTLVGVQFFLSISVLICTVFIYKQINAVFNAETGVDRKNIIVLETSLWYGAEDFIQVIKKENPNIVDASIALSAPYNSSYNHSGISWTGSKEGTKEMPFTQIFCDHNYANTFGLQVIQGQFIPPGLKWWGDWDESSFGLVINESFKKLMGVDNPIGLTVYYGGGYKGKIIGVVKDFNFKPLREPISPLILSFNPEASFNVYVKTTGRDKKATLDYILAKYKEMKPDYVDQPVIYHTVEDEYREMYEVELRTAGVLSAFSVISFLLVLMGIVSILSFMIEKRTKEIAVRRINGAKIRHIVRLFSRDILKVAAVVSAISIPLCYLVLNKWLQGYVYRTSLTGWIFIAIPLLIMLITLLVICIQVFLTAQKNPVASLRAE